MTQRLGPGAFRPRVLLVCHANHCRSPMAELLLRRAVDERAIALDVGSAGIAAAERRPMHALAAAALLERGVDADGWRSRRVTVELITAADLVLALDAAVLAVTARLAPSHAARSTTLLQFARLATVIEPLAAETPAEFAQLLRRSTAVARSRVPPPESADIRDPMGKGRRTFERCASVIANSRQHQ